MTDSRRRIGVLCVDDHRILLDGLELLINRQPDMHVVAAAEKGEDALKLFREHRPDVVLMDLHLRRMSGLDAIRAIRAEDPNARIIVLTTYHGDEDIYRALEAGARSYLLKDALSDELVNVIREVHGGARPIHPAVAVLLAARTDLPDLSPREITVIQLIAKGLRNKEIADVLSISEETVKVHIKNIFAKLKVSDRTAVVAVALRRGILHVEGPDDPSWHIPLTKKAH